jgi:catechol 2,3-dioxygenase-like lactoylglutathione lyase family enzyme
MKIERIDHLNLTVADIDRSVEFYERVLGMKTERWAKAVPHSISASKRSISTPPAVLWR